MAEIVNLRRFRKARLRAVAEAAGAENWATFGQKREEREARAAEARRATHRLEGHRLTLREGALPEAGVADD